MAHTNYCLGIRVQKECPYVDVRIRCSYDLCVALTESPCKLGSEPVGKVGGRSATYGVG